MTERAAMSWSHEHAMDPELQDHKKLSGPDESDVVVCGRDM